MNFYSAYSVQPRPSTLPERKAASSFEDALSSQDAIDRMAKMAKAENRAAGFGQIQTPKPRRTDTLAHRIFEYVRDNPRCYTTHLVNDLGKPARSIYSCLQLARSIAQSEGFDWNVEDTRCESGRTKRRYWLEEKK